MLRKESPLQTIAWNDERGSITLLDQTRLPGELATLECTSVDALIDAIQRRARCAPECFYGSRSCRRDKTP